MHKETKAKSISPSVKRAVYERDHGRCVYCHEQGEPTAHYISRAQGGLGIEENILTLCHNCHRDYDQTKARATMKPFFRRYLKTIYPNWDESKLIYRKD